jgi:hypothetical protein
LATERVGLAVVAALLTLALASGARAQPQAPAATARLEVEAAPSCSTRDEILARVAARSTRIRFVHDGTGLPILFARIEPGPRGAVTAALTVTDPDGRKFARRIEAPSCAAATDALALVVAITLDPSAATAETSGVGDTARSIGGATGVEAHGAGKGAPAPTAAATPPSPVSEAALSAEPAPDGGGDAGEEAGPAVRRVTAAVGAAAISGPAPILMPGIALEATFALDRASALSPALVVTLAHVWSGGLKESGGTAEFTLDLVGLDACPVRLILLRLEARACAVGTLGRLAARGSNTYEPRSVARPFAAAGGTVRLALPLASHVEVRARFGAAATLWRDAFEFTPVVFHRVASVTLVGDVGIGVRFP